jgi:hypothetical protein
MAQGRKNCDDAIARRVQFYNPQSIRNHQFNQQSPIQSAIRNQSAIHNQQSVNQQSAISNPQFI